MSHESPDIHLTIRPATTADAHFLREMLYEAICWRPEGERPPIDELLAKPELGVIIADWGREGDVGRIATIDGFDAGAAFYRRWTRVHHTYGFVDDGIPEIGIGLLQAYRRQGIGTRLLKSVLDSAIKEGFEQISLSVEKENPALHLYRRLGFNLHRETEEDYVMIKNL